MRYLLLFDDGTIVEGETDLPHEEFVKRYIKRVRNFSLDVIRFHGGEFQLLTSHGEWQGIGGTE